jgi:hypothetical protein
MMNKKALRLIPSSMQSWSSCCLIYCLMLYDILHFFILSCKIEEDEDHDSAKVVHINTATLSFSCNTNSVSIFMFAGMITYHRCRMRNTWRRQREVSSYRDCYCPPYLMMAYDETWYKRCWCQLEIITKQVYFQCCLCWIYLDQES